jgi:hypothetical protein
MLTHFLPSKLCPGKISEKLGVSQKIIKKIIYAPLLILFGGNVV